MNRTDRRAPDVFDSAPDDTQLLRDRYERLMNRNAEPLPYFGYGSLKGMAYPRREGLANSIASPQRQPGVRSMGVVLHRSVPGKSATSSQRHDDDT